MGPQVQLIDSGVETARTVKQILNREQLLAPSGTIPEHRFYLSDLPYKFQEIAERFLEQSIPHVHTANLEDFFLHKEEEFRKKYRDILEKIF